MSRDGLVAGNRALRRPHPTGAAFIEQDAGSDRRFFVHDLPAWCRRCAFRSRARDQQHAAYVGGNRSLRTV